MKRVFFTVAFCVGVSIVLASVEIRRGHAESKRIECQVSNSDGWGFSAHPYMGPGYESRPVVVTAVKTTAKTLTVSEIRIRNTSSKTVASIKLGWTISNESIEKVPISQGVSTLIPIEKSLAPGGTTLLSFPLVSFSELKQQLVDAGNLKGQFDAYVFVSQIVFSDNSSWKVGDNSSGE